jgi:hypothetical protein
MFRQSGLAQPFYEYGHEFGRKRSEIFFKHRDVKPGWISAAGSATRALPQSDQGMRRKQP